MTVLLTHGYFIHEDLKEKEIMRPYPPLGLLYISAYLKEKGIQVSVLDATFSSKADFQQQLLLQRPNILAFYVNLMTKRNVLELIAWIKTQDVLSSTRIILGGPDITYNTWNYLQAGADVLVIGEGEETMFELVQTFQQQQSLSSIEGIAFLDEHGKEIRTQERKKRKDVDGFPMPDREAINLQQYIDVWKKHHGSGMISVSTQRGCPYTCKWCSTAVYGQSYRRRSPAKVVEELQHLVQQYDCNTFWFVDDVFTVSHRWLKEFAELVKQKNLDIRYECISRADRMDEQVITWLKESGCFKIWIGAESGSQKIIDAMDRRVEVQQVRNIIRQTQAAGIEAGTFIMLGYPGEDKSDIEETILHLKEADPSHFTITIAYPIKGTSLYSEIEDQQVNHLDWNSSTDRDRDFKRKYPRKFYEVAVRKVVNEVHFHKLKKTNKHLSIQGVRLWLKFRIAGIIMSAY
jgi:radical SAM superfamily enzyme YgiQ (UPF0313 family)